MSPRRRLSEVLSGWGDLVRGTDGAPRRTAWAFGLYAGHLVSLGAIALSNTLLGLAAIVAPWRWSRDRLRAAGPLLLAIAAYLLFLAGSILGSYEPATSLRAASDLFNFLVPVVALVVVRRADQARLLIKALIIVGTLIAALALYQWALGSNHIEQRAAGPFSHYMTLGGFLVLVDCFLLAWMAFGDGWRRWWSWLSFGLIQAALLVSYTRNAWIAVAVLLTLIGVLKAPRILLGWIPLALVLTLMAPSALVARFGSIFDLSDESNYDRLCMAYAGIHMIGDKPIFGQGPRMVRERYALYRHPTTPRQWVPHLHNSFLNLAAERGLTSLLALAALLVLPFRRALRSLGAPRNDPPPDADILFATLLVVIATLVTGLFEDYWSDTEIQRLVLFALALPYCLQTDREAVTVQSETRALAA